MTNWFTIDRIDDETHIISEYRHWEETHCYLLNGKEKSLLIDTGIILEDINISRNFMHTQKNLTGWMENSP